MPSFASATGVMASPSEAHRIGAGLWPRLFSALCFGPLVLAVFYIGPPLSDLALALAGSLMLWEWLRLTGAVASWRSQWSWLALLPALVVLCAAGHLPIWALLALPLGLVVAFFLQTPAGGPTAFPRLWLLAGLAYVSIPLLSLQWIRNQAEDGMLLVFFLLACVWVSDSAAYFVGKTVGGPKLFPRVSPKKTWSGGIAGLLAGALAWLIGMMLYAEGSLVVFALIGILLSLVCICGDFVESALKRHFGVKDSGRLIPGHGGILDRVDGLMFAAVVLAIISMLWGSPLSWQFN